MYVLFIVLNQVDYLDEILLGFVEAGVGGATIIDSQGMAGAMVENQTATPFMGLLKNFLDDCKPYNKTIFTVLESETVLEDAVQIVKDVLGDAAKAGAGFMFSVPIGRVYKFDE